VRHRVRPLYGSVCKQRLNVPAAAQDAKNQHIFVLKPVNNDVFAHRKAPQARAEISIPAAADIGIIGKKEESFCNGINQAVCNIDAAALGCDVVPNTVEVGIRLRAADVRH